MPRKTWRSPLGSSQFQLSRSLTLAGDKQLPVLDGHHATGPGAVGKQTVDAVDLGSRVERLGEGQVFQREDKRTEVRYDVVDVVIVSPHNVEPQSGGR
jgi:sortase (surface protein transpeptidase)